MGDNLPNDASKKSKAEGERMSDNTANTPQDPARTDSGADERAGGITNRPLDEEEANQEALPERGESQPGAHAGHGDRDRGDRDTASRGRS
jgi:hypothetical protein